MVVAQQFILPGVDEIEDARFPSFHKAQQLSTRWTYLIETKHIKNRALSRKPKSVLGAGGAGVQIAPPKPLVDLKRVDRSRVRRFRLSFAPTVT
jgi:hypothetical protein